MASAFFPLLLPVTMVKPQIGLPVALTHLSRRGVAACVGLMLLSLVIMPKWPWWWMHQLGNYEHFIPLLILPGPILALALWRYFDKDAWLLFLMACMPQRWFFDTLILWLIPGDAARNSGDCLVELERGHLALVSLPAQLCGSWPLDGVGNLPAHAGSGAASKGNASDRAVNGSHPW